MYLKWPSVVLRPIQLKISGEPCRYRAITKTYCCLTMSLTYVESEKLIFDGLPLKLWAYEINKYVI